MSAPRADAHSVQATSVQATLAPVSEGDCDTLARYLASWPNERDAAWWRRRFPVWWDDNPFFSAGSARGWTLRSEHQIRGFFGLVPLRLQVAGQETTAFASTTWRADPALRHHSLTAIAQVMRHTKGSLLFISTLTPALVKILAALKFVPLPRGGHFYGRQRNTLPLRVDRFSSSKFAVRVALRAPSAIYRAYPRAVAARLALSGRGLTSRELAKADTAFDDLWARTRHQAATTNVRTAAYFNWHCSPGAGSKKLYGCYRDNRLVGACMAWPRPARRGTLVHECVDLWTDAAEPRAAASLLSALVAGALRDGADFVEVPHVSPTLHTLASSAGFLPRTLSDRGEVFLGPKDTLAAIDDQNSFFCSLQGDYGL